MTADLRDAIFDVSACRTEIGARTGRSARTVLVVAAIKIATALGTTAVLARLVPPAEQGLVALAIPAVLLAASISEFGLAQALVQRPHITHRLASTLFWINVALGILCGFAIALLGWPAARLYEKPEIVSIFLGLTPYVLFTVLGTQYVAILRRQLRVGVIELCSLGSALLASAAAVVAACAGAGYWVFVLQLVLAEAFNMVFLVSSVRWWPSPPWRTDISGARDALRFGGYLAAEGLIGELVHNMQFFVIGRVFSSVETGLFFRAQTMAQMPGRRISAPLAGAFVPALSRLQDDKNLFCEMYHRQVTRGNLIMIPIGVLVISCSDVIVHVLLGDNWLDAIPLLSWLGLLPLMALNIRSFAWAMVACGRGRELFLFRLATAPILIMAIVGGAQMGIVELVAVYVVALTIVQCAILAVVVVRTTPLTVGSLARSVLRDCVVAGLVLALTWGLRTWLVCSPALIEGLAAAGFVAICYITLVLLDPALRSDAIKALGFWRR